MAIFWAQMLERLLSSASYSIRTEGVVASGRSEYALSMLKFDFVEVETETHWNAF
ncbi:MAG: hypothetical protein QXU67_04915 [Candidatus Bathyarchaeia archaeon]